MNTADWAVLDARHVWHPFDFGLEAPLPVVAATGSWLLGPHGERWLDAVSSWWVTTHGHADPHIAQAIARQAAVLDHSLFADHAHPPAAQLAAGLAAWMPAGTDRFFFSDDGSTAVEVALKLVLHRWSLLGKPRTRFAALEDAYHGDTVGAMSASARGVFTQPYGAVLFDVVRIPRPDEPAATASISALEEAHNQNPLAGLVLEPLVQGAAGMKMYPAEALAQLVDWAHANAVPVVFDEVFTGFGRTRKAFAFQHLEAHLQPDLVCLSKGLTGGFLPLGLTAVRQDWYDDFKRAPREKRFLHGHSYTANPICCAAALANLEKMNDPGFLPNLQRIAMAHARVLPQLQLLPQVKHARQCGTILAVELHVSDAGYTSEVAPKAQLRARNHHNVLLRPLGNVLYTVPPYCMTDAELEQVHNCLLDVAQHSGHRA